MNKILVSPEKTSLKVFLLSFSVRFLNLVQYFEFRALINFSSIHNIFQISYNSGKVSRKVGVFLERWTVKRHSSSLSNLSAGHVARRVFKGKRAAIVRASFDTVGYDGRVIKRRGIDPRFECGSMWTF